MTKATIYISGPMSGLEDNNRQAFNEAAERLRKLDWIVINPAELDSDQTKDWQHYMRQDIKLLMDCDIIYMLDDWEKSRGSTLELFIATQIGMEVAYEP
jgi:hypothetical protein